MKIKHVILIIIVFSAACNSVPKQTADSPTKIDQLDALLFSIIDKQDTIGPQICDILPIFFELTGKTDYKMRPFVGYGHNFEEIEPDGSSNWDKMYWNDAVNEFILWVESF